MTWEGRRAIRISVSNWQTTDEEIDLALEAFRKRSAPASNAVEFLGREHQARGRTRPQQGWSALLRARVDSGAA